MGRSAWLGRLLALAWAAGALACAAWAWQGAAPTRVAAGVAATVVAGAWVARWWWRLPDRQLHWDGGAWHRSEPLAGEGAAGRIEPALDLQSALLLRWRGQDGGGDWIWAERSRLPARWDALRRAVYSRADADVLPGAKPPSPRP
ncbi:hypothetical protein PE066_15625 [Ramlibacter tataouinensis]|uniref:hypothetical protein n=1 Tax=Ramlibacter tataouinensis TaxID=94132 RepID=UPI0022F3C63D|nr:hypothetical protein [Ramlibacter tataouinensis]WBY00879.1 hypothetical protein PE066_15625 [Ramlibacter tataouinensis]